MPQINGQAESANKIVLKGIKKSSEAIRSMGRLPTSGPMVGSDHHERSQKTLPIQRRLWKRSGPTSGGRHPLTPNDRQISEERRREAH